MIDDDDVELTEDDEEFMQFVGTFKSKKLTKEFEYYLGKIDDMNDSLGRERAVCEYYEKKCAENVRDIVWLERRVKFLENLQKNSNT